MIGLHDSNSVTDTYELIYNPLKAGKFTGKIFFSNTKTGQFWYNLNLVAKTVSVSTVLKHLECMLGTETTILIPVENISGNIFYYFLIFLKFFILIYHNNMYYLQF